MTKPIIGDALTAVAAHLRCPRCAAARCEATTDGLHCRGCGETFPRTDGVLDLAPAGDTSPSGDRPYEGSLAAVYGWMMSSPTRQRLDSWLLGLNVRQYYREVATLLERLGQGPHLEVPCGNLPFLGSTSAYRDTGPWIFADLSRAMLDQLARRLGPGDTAGHLLLRADVCGLPIGDGQVGGVVSLFGLHCFRDGDAVFAEWRRCLRPGGRLVLSTLTGDGPALSRRYYRFNQRDGSFAPARTAAEVIALAERNGFVIEEHRRLGSVLLVAASLREGGSTS